MMERRNDILDNILATHIHLSTYITLLSDYPLSTHATIHPENQKHIVLTK